MKTKYTAREAFEEIVAKMSYPNVGSLEVSSPRQVAEVETPMRLGKVFTFSNKRKKDKNSSRAFSRLDFSPLEGSCSKMDSTKVDSDKAIEMLQKVQEHLRQQQNLLDGQNQKVQQTVEMAEQFKQKASQVEDFEEQINLLQKKHQQEMEEVLGR